jgi:hypothetical protein
MEPHASRRRLEAASRRQPTVSSSAIALFAEPCRATHLETGPVMIIWVEVGGANEPTLLGVDAGGQPRWFTFTEVTFDWRWSPELGRWADLEELVNPSVAVR